MLRDDTAYRSLPLLTYLPPVHIEIDIPLPFQVPKRDQYLSGHVEHYLTDPRPLPLVWLTLMAVLGTSHRVDQQLLSDRFEEMPSPKANSFRMVAIPWFLLHKEPIISLPP